MEVLHNYAQELKSEVAPKKKIRNNNYSQSAFDGAVERIRILEDGSRHKNIRITSQCNFHMKTVSRPTLK